MRCQLGSLWGGHRDMYPGQHQIRGQPMCVERDTAAIAWLIQENAGPTTSSRHCRSRRRNHKRAQPLVRLRGCRTIYPASQGGGNASESVNRRPCRFSVDTDGLYRPTRLGDLPAPQRSALDWQQDATGMAETRFRSKGGCLCRIRRSLTSPRRTGGSAPGSRSMPVPES
jgi:hypothetical protein